MTVWCCFCSFGEEEEEGGGGGGMKGGSSGEEVEGKREAVENRESENFGSHLGLGLGLAENAAQFDFLGVVLRSSDECASSSSGGANVGNFGLTEESSATALERESCDDHDYHHKRPKVHSFIQ